MLFHLDVRIARNVIIVNIKHNVRKMVYKMAEPGKRWENNMKKSLPGIIRLYDTTNGFAGIKNPCDFIYYVYPYEFLIECKSVQGNTFNFNLITDYQKEQLDYHNHIYGKTSLVCIEFRDAKLCYAIPYELIKQLNNDGKKSIHYMKDKDIINNYMMPVKYARTNCSIDEIEFKHFLKKLGGVNEVKTSPRI